MAIPDSVRALEQDLRTIFGPRLQAIVIYRPTTDTPGASIPTLVTVEALTPDDLRACASRVDWWHDAGLATPLILAAAEFKRALDVFPLEFGAILSDHTPVVGRDPFQGLTVDAADLRRACEVQVRSHLLHLREGYIETRGRGDAVAALVTESAAPLAGLVKSVARLLGTPSATGLAAATSVEAAAGLPNRSLSAILAPLPLRSEEARRLFPSYLLAIEGLAHFVDRWSTS
jgi:hypothetical protein